MASIDREMEREWGLSKQPSTKIKLETAKHDF